MSPAAARLTARHRHVLIRRTTTRLDRLLRDQGAAPTHRRGCVPPGTSHMRAWGSHERLRDLPRLRRCHVELWNLAAAITDIYISVRALDCPQTVPMIILLHLFQLQMRRFQAPRCSRT